MQAARVTRSQAKTLSSTTQPTTPSSPPPVSSPSSSDDVNALFDGPTPTLTPSPTPSQMADDQQRDTPPHLASDNPQAPASNTPSAANSPPPATAPPPPPPPAMDPQLQLAMTTLIEAMTRQFQAQPPPPANPPRRQRRRSPSPDRHVPRTRVKTRDPDPYDGSDPSKLRAFLSQCKLVFRACPDDFDDDEVKITYAVSWLKGTAQRWYEPTLSLDDRDLPQFALQWDVFEETLKATFGEPDPVNSATQKLDNLRMLDHHHITKYNVDFNEHSAITGFGERALYAKYYKGLAPRIKDGLVYTGRPATLADLRAQAINLDLRYWERHDEDKYKESSSQSTKTSSGTTSSTTNASSSSRQKSSRASTSRSSTPATNLSTPSAKKLDLSKVLGPDGKLLPEEKERRKKNGLCIICASKDHMADKCPARKDQAQGKVAHIESLSEEEDSASEAEFDSPN
jgi:hypothetical protein